MKPTRDTLFVSVLQKKLKNIEVEIWENFMNILKINLRKYSFRHVVSDFYFVSVCEHVKGAR